jgi:hypothetical protein
VARGPGSSSPNGATLGDTIFAPRSSDVVDPGATELELLGYPGKPSQPANSRQVVSSAELAYSWVAATDQLLREAIVMVS